MTPPRGGGGTGAAASNELPAGGAGAALVAAEPQLIHINAPGQNATNNTTRRGVSIF